IVEVIIIALLINFSMFFTEVIIDASNIVALIFYNKISVVTTDATGNSSPRPYASVSGEKDVAGGMVSAFDPTTTLTNQNFFNQATKVYDVTGTEQPSAENGGKVPASVLFGITVLAGAIMLFACYALFIAGISFLGRLIELWVLIIFSPFAFMSSTIPILETAEYIGWKAWFSRLLKVAFMAAIFMFFLYFIFMLIHANIFGTLIALTPGASGPAATIKTILGIVLPTFFILILLMKATKFAKEGSGALGEMLIKGTEIAMGVVAGVGLGVAAKGLQGTVGQVSSRMANSEWAKKREAEGKFGGALFRKTTQGLARSSFDVRQGAVGGVLAAAGGISGLNLGHSSKLFKEAGGFEADKKKRSESRVARAKELELGESSAEKRAVRAAENNLAAAKADPITQARLVDLNEGDRTAAAGTAAAMGLGALGREVTRTERAFADAERELKDARATLTAAGPAATAAQRLAVTTAETTQAAAVTARDDARNNVLTREADIRTAGGDIHRAEVALKVAQNAAIGASNQRRISYANVVENNFLQNLSFINAGGRWALGGTAQEETADKIRAGVQAEQKIPAAH
ncbi:MAG: hypothetical protein WAN61_04165, partial [Minisyncoccia bacterium]